MAPTKATTKRLSKAGASTTKSLGTRFASKFVNTILSTKIDEKLKTITKNPKSTAQWFAKMKLSILRKVSEASRLLFCKEFTPESAKDALTESQKRLKDIIEKIESNKREGQEDALNAAFASLQEDSHSKMKENAASNISESAVENINKQFGSLAEKVTSLNQHIQSRSASLKTTTDAVESQWESISNILETERTNQGVEYTQNETGILKEGDNMSEANPYDILLDHLQDDNEQ